MEQYTDHKILLRRGNGEIRIKQVLLSGRANNFACVIPCRHDWLSFGRQSLLCSTTADITLGPGSLRSFDITQRIWRGSSYGTLIVSRSALDANRRRSFGYIILDRIFGWYLCPFMTACLWIPFWHFIYEAILLTCYCM